MSYKRSSWIHKILKIAPKVNVVTTNMGKVSLIVENNVGSSVLEYLNFCLDAGSGSIDEQVVKVEEAAHAAFARSEIKHPDHYKDFV